MIDTPSDPNPDLSAVPSDDDLHGELNYYERRKRLKAAMSGLRAMQKVCDVLNWADDLPSDRKLQKDRLLAAVDRGLDRTAEFFASFEQAARSGDRK
jgi:hypothetical protein